MMGVIGVMGIMGERRKFKEFREFKEISENLLDFFVIVRFFGFRGYSRREYK